MRGQGDVFYVSFVRSLRVVGYLSGEFVQICFFFISYKLSSFLVSNVSKPRELIYTFYVQGWGEDRRSSYFLLVCLCLKFSVFWRRNIIVLYCPFLLCIWWKWTPLFFSYQWGIFTLSRLDTRQVFYLSTLQSPTSLETIGSGVGSDVSVRLVSRFWLEISDS